MAVELTGDLLQTVDDGIVCLHIPDDGSPVFIGSEEEYLQFKPKKTSEPVEKEIVEFEGKNPIMWLNEYFPGLEYSWDLSEDSSSYRASVEIEDIEYSGTGSNRKVAKTKCALHAVEGLSQLGRLSELEAEKKEHKRQKLQQSKQQALKHNDLAVQMDSYRNRLRKNPPLPKNALAKINDFERGLTFEVQSEEAPVHDQAAVVSLRFKGATYIGVGRTKKMAKLNASEKAIRAIGMWDEQDESVKSEIMEEERKLSTTSHAGMGTNSWRGKKFMNSGAPRGGGRGAPPQGGRGWNNNRGWGRGRGRGRGYSITQDFVDFVPSSEPYRNTQCVDVSYDRDQKYGNYHEGSGNYYDGYCEGDYDSGAHGGHYGQSSWNR